MKLRALFIAAAVACGVAAPATAATWQWNWEPSGNWWNNNGNGINWIESQFNSSTKRLTWNVNFERQWNPSNVSNGFTLAIGDGSSPVGQRGKYALLYYDAKRNNDERLTAYGYNGKSDASSWEDGNGNQWGEQTPDRMKSSLRSTDWIYGLTDRWEQDGSRTLGFDIDATDLIDHSPMYPGPNGTSWKGAQFASQIGLWMRHSRDLSTEYHGNDASASKRGYLKKWNTGGSNDVDLGNEQCNDDDECDDDNCNDDDCDGNQCDDDCDDDDCDHDSCGGDDCDDDCDHDWCGGGGDDCGDDDCDDDDCDDDWCGGGGDSCGGGHDWCGGGDDCNHDDDCDDDDWCEDGDDDCEDPGDDPCNPVPEPSTVALLGLGAVGLVISRLRKRQK